MDREMERIVELLSNINEQLKNIGTNIEKFTEGRSLEQLVGNKIESIGSTLNNIQRDIGNLKS